jgi:hypothetical protein
LFLLLVLTGTWLPVQAQEPVPEPVPLVDWQELATQYFIIVYANSIELDGVPQDCPACGPDPANQYTAFVDEVYSDLADVFGTTVELPVNLRLFPTEESYRRVNLLAGETGSSGRKPTEGRSEITVLLPNLQERSQTQITNHFRQEMTHLFAAKLSAGKLNTGFQEGTGQYLEKPDETNQAKVNELRTAVEQNTLYAWAELEEPPVFVENPHVAYPQALSMVAFLIDRYGLPTYLNFIKVSADQPGYRSALEAAYGKSAGELEMEWRDYLPDYLNQRWQVNAVYAYDLSHLVELVNHGAFSDAETELLATVALLQTTNQSDVLAQAQGLLDRVQQGKLAGMLADDALRALRQGSYPETIEKGSQAITVYQQIGYHERIPEIQDHVHRANIGQKALDRLDNGENMLNSLSFFQAEREIYEATLLLQSLGNQAAAEHGIQLLHRSTERQRWLAYAIVGVGIAILLFGVLRRIYNHFTADPMEIEFTS